MCIRDRAVIAGEWDQVENYIATIDKHVNGTRKAWYSLKSWIEYAYPGANGLPDWCSTNASEASPQVMNLENGEYTISLDFSQKPDIAKVRWSLPDGWRQSISGSILTFRYSGATMPKEILEGDAPSSMKEVPVSYTHLVHFVSCSMETAQQLYRMRREVVAF